MPYNPQIQAPVLVSKQTRELIRAFAKRQRRTIQVMTEIMVEDYARNNLATLAKSAADAFRKSGVIPISPEPIEGIRISPMQPTASVKAEQTIPDLSNYIQLGRQVDEKRYNVVVKMTGQIVRAKLTLEQANNHLDKYNIDGDLDIVEAK